MAAQGPLATFEGMLTSYVAYRALTDDEQRAHLQARANFKHPQTETFKDGPGDLTVMAQALQAALKVATAITTSHAYGPNEDIGVALCVLRSMAMRLIWCAQHSRTRRRPTALRFACMARSSRCCGHISRHAQPNCGGMRVTFLFSRQASARDGPRLFGFMTYNVSLPSLLRRKHTMSRGSIRPHGASSSRSWRTRRSVRLTRVGSSRCFIPRRPATSLRGQL